MLYVPAPSEKVPKAGPLRELMLIVHGLIDAAPFAKGAVAQINVTPLLVDTCTKLLMAYDPGRNVIVAPSLALEIAV